MPTLVLRADGTVAAANARVADLCGRTDLVGVPLASLLHADDADGLNLDTADGDAVRLLHPDGAPRRVRLFSHPADGGGSLVCLIPDDSERLVLETSSSVLARVARDIHDGVGQTLVGASMLSSVLASELGESAHRDDVKRLQAYVQTSLLELRQFALGLDPIDMADIGVDRALKRVTRDAAEMFGVEICLTTDRCESISTEAALDVVRIVQEAITNAVRHGEAERVEVELRCGAQTLDLTITDDGKGIADGAHMDFDGMGLRTMRSRARRLGGSLQLRRAARGGTVVHLRGHLVAPAR